MMKKNDKGFTSRVLWMLVRVLVICCIFAVMLHFDMLNFAKVCDMLSSTWFAVAVFFFLISVVFSVLRWQLLLEAVDIRPGIMMLTRLTFIGYAFSTIIPGSISGDMVKVYYIVKSVSNNKTAAAMSIVLDRVLGLFTLLLTAAIAASAVLVFGIQSFARSGQENDLWSLWCFLAISLLIFLFAFCFSFIKSSKLSKLMNWVIARIPGGHFIEKLFAALALFREKKHVIFKAVFVSLLGQIPLILGMYFIGRAAGEYRLNVVDYFFLAPVSLILNALPLTPGGLGSGEVFAESLFSIFGSTNGGEILSVFHVAFIVFSLTGFLFYAATRHDCIESVSLNKSC
ncbi:MAG: flippase-like domain-containing protein [Proteobacteria bacterium]|nr:flippase-like domain-containing protein [Pseudomonadota bacterium]MBU0964833.1 flippase-like domain-containing protein [Pseudomonadota bacterium]